jgi:hypothetical protein
MLLSSRPCVIDMISMLSMGEYGWGALVLLCVLGICGGYYLLRWCRQTVKSVAAELQGSIDLEYESETTTHAEPVLRIKKDIKALLTEIKDGLTKVKREREDAIHEMAADMEERNGHALAAGDYRSFYDATVEDMHNKLLLVKTQLKMIPPEDSAYLSNLKVMLRRIDFQLHSLHPDRLKDALDG